VVRALAGGMVFVVGAFGLLVFEQGLLGLSADVATLVAQWPGWMVDVCEAVLLVAVLAGIAGVNVVLVTRRRCRRAVLVNAAAVTALLLGAVAGHVVLAVAPSNAVEQTIEDASANGLGNDLLASVVAVITVATVWIGPRLRPWAIGLVAATVTLSLLGGAVAIITLPFDVGVGLLAGASVALILRTQDGTPTADEVAATLGSAGIDVTHVERAAVDARGSVPWFARTTTGDELFVKTLGSDQRAADLLFRLYRAVRLRGTGDHRPFSSLRRASEHEAFLSLAAESRGIRTPHLVSVCGIGTDGMLLAHRRLGGSSLDTVDRLDLTSAVLDDIWRRVAQLRAAGIAHRDLRLANLFLADDGAIWLIDFGFADLAADGPLLARDVAELLASTAAAVGPRPAADAAVRVLGADAVTAAIPWIQPLALSSATRDRIGGRGGCVALREVVATTVASAGVPRPERFARVGPWSMIRRILGTRLGNPRHPR
jgi:hypothetical protein